MAEGEKKLLEGKATKTCLILQVLGTNDIWIDGDKEGLWKKIKGPSREDIEQNLDYLREDIEQGNIEIQFPLIESLLNQLNTEDKKVSLGVILSNQTVWAENKYQTIDHEGIWDLVAKDGVWAQDFLEQWLKEKDLDYYLLTFDIEDDFKYGVADWEATDNKITPFLNQYLIEKDAQLYWRYEQESPQAVEKIIIQHSTGTPALKGALYLWGIEKKLANYPIEFIYLSEDEKCVYGETPTRSGKHWQWHLRLPLIRELLDIKDFSGALRLVENVPDSHSINTDYIDEVKKISIKEHIEKELKFLDRAVSFNLKEGGLSGRKGIIERIALALWTEAAYRERQHWMHWYLRLAGAFELAILLLVESQGKGRYQWQNQKLIFDNQEKYGEVGLCPINEIINQLLPKGIYEHKFRNKDKKKEKEKAEKDPKNDYIKTVFTVEQIGNDKQWKNFKTFYFGQWLEKSFGFGSLRNKLYHQLIGEAIDEGFDRDESVAKEVVAKLDYIIKLGNISEEINLRIQFYQDKYNKLFAQLLQLNNHEKI